MDNKAKISAKIWFSAIFFGLIGQIAWVVENMYFATFAQDVFSNSQRGDLSYLVTTLMVIFSALTATATTIVAGGICDKVGKRKPFIAFGYIIWGMTIMLFAAIPMKVSTTSIAFIAALLVIFDCLMTVVGSTANDAAFNAWVADNTNTQNRGKLNAVLSTLFVFAVVIVFIGLGSLYNSKAESNRLFFIILGIIPIAAGIIAIFTLKDADNIVKIQDTKLLKEFFYGFSLKSIKKNPILYICLSATCLIGIAQQTFFSYLINFLQITLGLEKGFVVPMAVIIVVSAIICGATGFLSDKLGRNKFYFPLLFTAILGMLSFYLIQWTSGAFKTTIIYIGGILMMGSLLSMTGMLTSTFQDHIPEGHEGRNQGVRMCFTVLIPMIIGPIISLILGLDTMGMNGDGFVPPYSMFLAAAIVATLAIVPIIFIVRKKKDAQL